MDIFGEIIGLYILSPPGAFIRWLFQLRRTYLEVLNDGVFVNGMTSAFTLAIVMLIVHFCFP